MKYIAFTFFLLVNINSHAAEPYLIGPGDLLAIIVYGEPDLSLPQVRVGTEETVSFPLLGEVFIGDLVVGDVEKKLAGLLLDGYLKKPKVTVSILEYRLFYVTGQVKNPGGYNYINGLTVRKAIAIAGGFTIRGSKGKMIKIPEKSNTETVNVKLNSPLGPGDILNVGESFF
ncbi:MAG: polysaccharide export protein [Gammaproteobacteria bacterium]|nr:polysaccharide export protein [Gammaproteobacteria bacterium]